MTFPTRAPEPDDFEIVSVKVECPNCDTHLVVPQVEVNGVVVGCGDTYKFYCDGAEGSKHHLEVIEAPN